MFQTSLPLLSLVIWLPILGGFACLLLGDSRANTARWLSLIVALAAGEEREGHPVASEGPEIGLSAAGLSAETRTAPKGKRFRQRLFILGQYLLTVGLYRFGLTLGRFDPKIYRQDVARNTSSLEIVR